MYVLIMRISTCIYKLWEYLHIYISYENTYMYILSITFYINYHHRILQAIQHTYRHYHLRAYCHRINSVMIIFKSVMIAQWDTSLSVPIPSHGGVFQGIFPWLIALCQPVLSQCGRKWLNLPSKTPHNLCTARRKAEVQLWTDDGW